MIRRHNSLQAHTCANPLPCPKQTWIWKSGLRQVGKISEKLSWCFPIYLWATQRLTLPTTTCLLKRSTAEQLWAHRLLRQINPDQACLWLQNYSWAFRILSIVYELSHCILTISPWRTWVSPSDPPVPWVRIIYPYVPRALFPQFFPIVSPSQHMSFILRAHS